MIVSCYVFKFKIGLSEYIKQIVIGESDLGFEKCNYYNYY